MTRPIGPAHPLVPFETFLDQLRPFHATALATGLTTFSWDAWRGLFPTKEANSLSIAVAGPLAALALALGALDGKDPTLGEIVDLHYRYLAIDSTSDALIDRMAAELARLARESPIAVMLPDLAAARLAITSLTLARAFRLQWLPARTRFDELSRTWWIARRIDAQATHLDRVNRVLGMSVPTFVRAATALLAFAVTSEPHLGRVNLNRSIDQAFIDRYDVDADVLSLAAFKLATSRAELQTWLDDLLRNTPQGLRHDAPTPLNSTPLLRVDDLVEPALPAHSFFCVHQFITLSVQCVIVFVKPYQHQVRFLLTRRSYMASY